MLPMNLISDSKEMTARCSKNAFHAELRTELLLDSKEQRRSLLLVPLLLLLWW